MLDAALELFIDGGIAATTIEAIAERTGTSRSTVYRRWRTREEIVLAAIERLRAAQETQAEDWSTRPIAEVLELFARLTVAAVADPRSMALLRQMVALEPESPIKRAYWDTVLQPRRETFARMVTEARDQGDLPEGLDPHLLQDLLGGGLAYRLLMHPEPLTAAAAERYVAQLLDVLGLRPVRPRERATRARGSRRPR